MTNLGTKNMGLCFDEAYEALRNHQITDEEYIHHALAHFCGERHPADEKAQRPWVSMVSDPVGNAIRAAALSRQHGQRTLEDVAQLEKLFASVLSDDAGTVASIVSELHSEHDLPLPLQAMATFAALHNEAAVLRYCLDLGATLDDCDISMALEYATRGATLLDLLYAHDWRNMRTCRKSFDRLLAWSLHTGPEELRWFLNHGGSVDKDLVRRATHGSPVKASCIELLVQRYGVRLFQRSGLLQSAAKRGQIDVLKCLLDAGAEVDELATHSAFTNEKRELSALYEAVYGQHEEIIQLLLRFGADPSKEVCVEGLKTPLQLARGHDYTRIVSMLQRHLEKGVAHDRTWTSRF